MGWRGAAARAALAGERDRVMLAAARQWWNARRGALPPYGGPLLLRPLKVTGSKGFFAGMRVFICWRGRGRLPEVIEELTTALLQEGHEVHVGKADRAARRFAAELVVARYEPGHFAAAWFARRRRVPLAVFVETAPRRPPRLFDRMIWRTASRVIAANAALKTAVAALGVDAGSIEIWPGGTVPERFLPSPFAPGRASDRVVLGWFGNAPGSIAAHGLVLSVIDDSVPPIRVADLIAGIDVAVFPHASALRIIDCMAAARAIVAPDTPEVRELLTHEQTALLFDAAEDGAVLRAAARLVADTVLRARLGEAARGEIIRRELTWRALARRLAGGGRL
jgi:glycosyltransferase involved in cell wall biosynthesis